MRVFPESQVGSPSLPCSDSQAGSRDHDDDGDDHDGDDQNNAGN